MKRLKFNEIAPGDIVFTARPSKLGSGIRFMSDGDASHAITDLPDDINALNHLPWSIGGETKQPIPLSRSKE